MKWPTYPKYKDSGVDWLGEVPEGWDIVAIKRLSIVQRGASPRPIDDPKYFDDDGTYAWVRISDVTNSSGLLTETTQRLSEIGSNLSVKIKPGDLFVSIAGSVGKPCISAIRACIHDGFIYFPHLTINPKFLYYIFEAGNCFGGLGKLGTQLNFNTDTVGDICISIPKSKSEITDVIQFIDIETQKIDVLIGEQEKLISLLQEKRQAVISHAVTKGLNPDAPMKDSGVEWLGEIPRTWQIKALRHLFNNQDYKRIPLSSEERGKLEKIYPYYGASGIIDYVDRFIFDEPLILVAEDGANLLSRSTPLAFLASGKCWVNNHAHIIKPVIGDIQYWVMLLQSYDYTSLITGAAQPKLTAERLSAIVLPCPPPDEQRTIAVYTIQENEKINSLIAEAENGVELLKERRTALISAAVTGKIDVRGLTASEPA